MKRIFAALAAALLCTSGGAAGSLPGVDQALVESDAMPPKLSAFGLLRGKEPKVPVTGIGYTLRSSLFSDYTDKHRFVAIPAGKTAKVAADGTIVFPVGTVLVKSFGWPDVNGGRPVETRLLIHRASGWTALPYIWDADGKDATLALGGRRVPVTLRSPDGEAHSIRYAVPNKNQCKECHSLRALPQSRGQRVEQRIVPALDRRSDRRELRNRQAADRGGARQWRHGIRDCTGRPRPQFPHLSPRKHRTRHRDARGRAFDGA